MKYSNTTLRELSARYRHVLRKCALFNVAVLMGVALSAPAMATEITDTIHISDGSTVTIAANDTVNMGENVVNKQLVLVNDGTVNIADGFKLSGFKYTTKSGSNHQDGILAVKGENAYLNIGDNVTFENITWANDNGGLVYVRDSIKSDGSPAVVIGDNFKVINVDPHNRGVFTAKNGYIKIGDGLFIQDDATQTQKATAIRFEGAENGKIEIGNNATFKNLFHFIQTYSIDGTVKVGNNATFENIEIALINMHSGAARNSVTIGDNAKFINNTGTIFQDGLYVDGATGENNSFTVGKNALIDGNKLDGVQKDGWAPERHLIDSRTATTTVTFGDGLTVSNNTLASNAVFKNASTLNLGSATFKNNKLTADEANKAVIYNAAAGVLNLSGDMTFTGNTADFDIVNDGVMNISGDVTLNLQHGISSANGSVVFKANSSLTTALNTSTAMFVVKSAEIESNAKLNLIIDPATKDGKYAFITAADGITGAFSSVLEKNALYDITMDADGFVDIKGQSKEAIIENIVDTTGATQQEAETMAAITGVKGNGTAVGNQIATALSEAIQLAGDSSNPAAASEAAKVAKKAAETLAPTNSAVSMGVASKTTALLADVTNNRLLTLSGRAGGDAFVGGGLWVQGLYNYSKQDASIGSTGFEANAEGIGFGIDGKINDNWSVGIGYGYLHTDAEAGEKDLKVNEHNIFVYGEYHPNNFYVNGMLKYGFAQYDEEKAPLGIAMKADYNVQSYAANLMTGYHFDAGFAPEAGLRYIYLNQDKYFDGAQDIKTDNNDVLTAIAGLKYTKDFTRRDWTFRPELSAMMTYDIFSSDTDAMVNVIGGGSYQVSGKRLHRLGTELGVGMKASVSDIDINVEYKAGLREDYQSHTGMVRAKYNF